MAVLLGKCYLCVCPTAIGHVQLPCCNGLITGDTPWALGDDNYQGCDSLTLRSKGVTPSKSRSKELQIAIIC
jgi:hypothetical protein